MVTPLTKALASTSTSPTSMECPGETNSSRAGSPSPSAPAAMRTGSRVWSLATKRLSKLCLPIQPILRMPEKRVTRRSPMRKSSTATSPVVVSIRVPRR